MPTTLECVSLLLTTLGSFAGILGLISKAEAEQEQKKEAYRYGWK